jgi:hypothetical protein
MLYLHETKHTILFVGLILLFLLIDVGQFFLIGTHVIPLLFPLYCVLLLHNIRYLPIACVAFLQCLESFCFYNFFFIPCIYLVPTSLLALFFRKNLYPSRAHIIILTLIGTFIQIYAIEGYFLRISPIEHYTIMRISGMLFITICFSLTINVWGMLDNRA